MTQKVSIVGMGYVGLCTAVVFTKNGYKLVAVDENQERIDLVNNGISPFHEPDLEQLLQESINNDCLECTSDIDYAILNTDITFLTVGTPTNSDGSIDLKAIKKVATQIGETLAKKDGYHLVVVKSTVVPGTTENVVKPIIEKNSGKTCGPDFGLCMNPEFLSEGSAVEDAFKPYRVVIGEYDKKSGEILEDLYQEIYPESSENKVTIKRTTLPTAELIKYANNGFQATKISYINTIANVCQKIPNADVTAIADVMGLDPVISPKFLGAGIGYGGSCFPKDIRAFITFCKSLEYNPIMLKATHEVNEKQAYNVIEIAKRQLKNLKGKKFAILGLAFKPNTDDMRGARSTVIIKKLLEEGSIVTAYDPQAISNAKRDIGDKITYAPSAMECIKDCDCCILVTEWDEFQKLTAEDFMKQTKQPFLIDGRRTFKPQDFNSKIIFAAIGLGQKNNCGQ